MGVTSPDALKAALCRHIDERRDDVIVLLRDFLRIRSVNPPGDTREAADFVRGVYDACDRIKKRQT